MMPWVPSSPMENKLKETYKRPYWCRSEWEKERHRNRPASYMKIIYVGGAL